MEILNNIAGNKRAKKKMRGKYRFFTNTFSVMLTVGIIFFLFQGVSSAGVKIRSSIEGDPINLDPAHLTYAHDNNIAQQIYQGLVQFDFTADPPYPIIPVLAKSYKVSDDGKIITFRLQKGIQFHHGYGEFTSEDAVFSLKRHMDPKVASRARVQFSDVDKIEATDKYTVKIFLKNSSGLTMTRVLGYPIAGNVVSKKAFQELGDKVARKPIGTGPYFFDRWQAGQKVVLKKFDQYWKGPAKIDEIEYWVIPEEIIALGALEKGDLDVVTLAQRGSPVRAKTIKGIYIAEAKGGARVYKVYFNQKMKPMQDVRVRKALAHALNINEICARIGPQVMPFPSPLPPIAFAATDEFWKYEYDLNKSKQLLAEAGYPNGFDFRLIYNKSGLYEPIALESQSSWNKVVNVKLDLIEKAVWIKKFKEYKHHAMVWAASRYAPSLFSPSFVTGSPKNYLGYSNPKVDEIIIKAKTATKEEESRKYWREFQRLLTNDVPEIWIANGKSLAAIRSNIKGVVVVPYPGLVSLENAYFE